MDQGSIRKCSAVHKFAPTVTKFGVMWEGQALPHDTKFGNCRCEIAGRRVIFIWSLIHGSSWSGLIKAEPGIFWSLGYIMKSDLGTWRFSRLWVRILFGYWGIRYAPPILHTDGSCVVMFCYGICQFCLNSSLAAGLSCHRPVQY